MKDFYNCKQSRIGRLVLLICSQNPYRLFAMLVLSPSFFIDLTLQPKVEAKFSISLFSLYLHHFYGTKCVLKSKEPLRNLLELQFDYWRSRNKELLELGVELGSLQKSVFPG